MRESCDNSEINIKRNIRYTVVKMCILRVHYWLVHSGNDDKTSKQSNDEADRGQGEYG